MRSIPAFAQVAFLEFVSAHAANGDPDAQRCMDKLPTKGVKKRLDLPGKSKADRRADHRASTGDLRAQVFARSGADCTACTGGHCEVCRVDLGASWEMHHVQGKGERRSAQRLGNVLAVCWECHRLIHRGDLDTLRKVAQAPTLDAQARREAQHRIDKLMEARGVAVRLEVSR